MQLNIEMISLRISIEVIVPTHYYKIENKQSVTFYEYIVLSVF